MQFSNNFLDTYATTNNKASEVGSKRTTFRLHLNPFLGHLPLDQIDAEQIEKYKTQKLKSALSPKSVNNQVTILRKLLVVALK